MSGSLTNVGEVPGDANGLCVDTSRGDIYVTQYNYNWHYSMFGNSDATIERINTYHPIAPSWEQHHDDSNPSTVGDPHFTGFHGDKFDVKGDAYQVYNLM